MKKNIVAWIPFIACLLVVITMISYLIYSIGCGDPEYKIGEYAKVSLTGKKVQIENVECTLRFRSEMNKSCEYYVLTGSDNGLLKKITLYGFELTRLYSDESR